jgi:hypothetical protein
MRDAELLADLAQIACDSGLIWHYARAANHFKVRDASEIGEDFILYSVGEERIGFVVAQVFKRQYRNALLGNGREIGFHLRRGPTKKYQRAHRQGHRRKE